MYMKSLVVIQTGASWSWPYCSWIYICSLSNI